MSAILSRPVSLALEALDPRRYWSAFKLWSYPFPFHNTPESLRLRETLALLVLCAWMALFLGAAVAQLRDSAQGKGQIAWRWLAALVCIGFGALVILADSPLEAREARPHVTAVMTGACIFTGAYALRTLSSRFALLRAGFARAAGSAAVLLIALGAETGISKSQVDNRADQLDFIRTELSALAPEEFDRIVVIFAPQEYICVCEPCDEWSGKVIHFIYHARRPEQYMYALSSLGIPPHSKEIDFVTEYVEPRERDLVVDWRKFLSARKSYKQHFPWGFPFRHRRVPAGAEPLH